MIPTMYKCHACEIVLGCTVEAYGQKYIRKCTQCLTNHCDLVTNQVEYLFCDKHTTEYLDEGINKEDLIIENCKVQSDGLLKSR